MFSDQKYQTGRCQTFPFLWRPAGCEFVIFVPACWSHHSMPVFPFVPLLYYFTWLVFWCRLWIPSPKMHEPPLNPYRIIKNLLSMIWKNRNIPPTEEVEMLRFSLCTLHSIYKEGWQCEHVLRLHTHLPSHTHFYFQFIHTPATLHTAEEDTVCLLVFKKIKIHENFFAMKEEKKKKTP